MLAVGVLSLLLVGSLAGIYKLLIVGVLCVPVLRGYRAWSVLLGVLLAVSVFASGQQLLALAGEESAAQGLLLVFALIQLIVMVALAAYLLFDPDYRSYCNSKAVERGEHIA